MFVSCFLQKPAPCVSYSINIYCINELWLCVLFLSAIYMLPDWATGSLLSQWQRWGSYSLLLHRSATALPGLYQMYSLRSFPVGTFSTSLFHLSEKVMASHSSTLAWKIPWMEEPGRLQSTGSRRVKHHWATSLSLFTFMHWGRKWQPTPVFLLGESQGLRSLVGSHLWGHTESDTTEAT